MTSSLVVQRFERAALPALDPRAWREDLLARLAAGQRPVTLYGRRQGESVGVTAVLQGPERALHVTRCTLDVHQGYHELSTHCPALHVFERELHEQTGLRVAGHPWPKPVRYEGQDQAAMSAYPYYELHGKEVHEVAVGPIHAGVIEPGAFRFLCLGEQVHHLEIQLGYQHRGVERRLLEGDPRRLAPLVETIAGDASIAHTWAYCAALESLSGRELPLEVEVARTFALELERVAMHLAGLAGLAADIGFLPGAATYGRLRTTAINTMMRLCGSRFGRGALRPGGIGLGLPGELVGLVRDNLELLRADLLPIDECFLGARTVQHRLRGVGTLDQARAHALGLVGLAARASGVAIDQRQEPRAGAYAALPIAACLREEGDCWARACLRIAELEASLSWLSRALEQHPRWEHARQPLGALRADQLVVALAESWRGEVVHCLETGAEGELVHYKAQDPSLRNWMGLAIAVRRNEISDFPICNKSFDLSYCGNDL